MTTILLCFSLTTVTAAAAAAMMTTTTTSKTTAPSNTVRVQVEQSLPGITPRQAKEAWITHQWKEGVGLPAFVVHPKASEVDESTTTAQPRTTRRLLPINMQETLLLTKGEDDRNDLDHEQKGNGEQMIRYKVTDMGWLAFDLEQDSHEATVKFVPADKNKDDDDDDNASSSSSTEMIWTVTFRAINRVNLWKKITEFNVQMAASHLAMAVAVPLLYRQTTQLTASPPKQQQNNLTTTTTTSSILDDVTNEWIDFVWKRGGGLPTIVPPIQIDNQRRIYVPPFLVERLVSTEVGEIRYAVDNPGLFTYQVYTHAGRVRFEEVPNNSKIVQMVWEVEVRPMKGCAWFVKLFTSAVISTLGRNFRAHVNEPGATVSVAPPRGKGEAFAKVPKDTWLGGVLDAHLSDRRSTFEQTLAMFQPWTWGRGEGEEDSWTTGYM